MMTTMAAFAVWLCRWHWGKASVPSCSRPLGIAMVGGVFLLSFKRSRLYTTPVIYVFFDRLAQRFGHESNEPETGNQPEPAAQS